MIDFSELIKAPLSIMTCHVLVRLKKSHVGQLASTYQALGIFSRQNGINSYEQFLDCTSTAKRRTQVFFQRLTTPFSLGMDLLVGPNLPWKARRQDVCLQAFRLNIISPVQVFEQRNMVSDLYHPRFLKALAR
jgi:hypothetical protein